MIGQAKNSIQNYSEESILNKILQFFLIIVALGIYACMEGSHLCWKAVPLVLNFGTIAHFLLSS